MIDKLPISVKNVNEFTDYWIITSDIDENYILLKLDQDKYSIYNELIKYCDKIAKSIYDFVKDDNIYLLFYYNDDKTSDKVKIIKIIDILESLFEKSSYEVILKKQNITNLNKMYQILDRKFTYFEFRIREIETSPYKNDISWIVLSKYNIILDSKLFLYDLQQDIFKMIDKEEVVKYGIIYRKIDYNLYQKECLLPYFDLYYGPISMVYARYFICFESMINRIKFKEKINSLNFFNQKYFCFMVIYIYILNLNFDINFDNYNIGHYVNLTKKIKEFIVEYEDIIKK